MAGRDPQLVKVARAPAWLLNLVTKTAPGTQGPVAALPPTARSAQYGAVALREEIKRLPVSYTHLTLPTIYSV